MIISAHKKGETTLQIWSVKFPEGSARRVTNDFNDYIHFSLSKDASKIVAMQGVENLHLGLFDKETGTARQITSGVSRSEGRFGLAFAPDNRIWFGEGGADNNNLVLPAEKLGIRGDFSKAAVPRSMAPYKAGYLYFHGGASLPEAVVPVLVVKLQPIQNIRETLVSVEISYKNGAKKVTTRLPVIEVEFHSDNMFDQQVEVLIEAYDENEEVVGTPSSGGDINPATQTVTLTKGNRMQIVLRMLTEFEGKFTIKAINPTTRATYGTLNLQTDYAI